MNRLKWLVMTMLILVLVLLGFAGRLVMTYFTLTNEERHLQGMNQPLFVPEKHFYSSREKSEWLQSLIHLASVSQLQVLSVSSIKIQNGEDDEMIFLLQGGFSQMMTWLLAAAKNRIPLCVDSLEISTGKNVENIKLKLRMLNQPVNAAMPKQSVIVDPFVKVINAGLQADDASLPVRFSVKQLRFSGFLQAGKKQLGVLLLPDGKSIDVWQGEKVGIENAVVSSVDSEKIIFQLNDQVIIKTMLQVRM